MQEVFEKIIEKLNSKKAYFQGFYECEGKTEHDADLNKVTQLAFDEAIEIVKQAAADYNNGWIPCSERLPERNKPVLCWVTSTTIASGETYIIGSCDNGFWFLQTYEIGHHHFPVKDYEVVAWQPLPEPYQPKGE